MSIPEAASVTKVYQNGSIWPRCTRTPFVFVSSSIEPVKGFSHHVQLRLAVPLEHAGIALPKHQVDEGVGYTTRAEPCGERVTQRADACGSDSFAVHIRKRGQVIDHRADAFRSDVRVLLLARFARAFTLVGSVKSDCDNPSSTNFRA
jgi:hypothetical protein